MNSSAEILFRLLRLALGCESEGALPETVDWNGVVDLAFDQGVAAIAVGGLQKSGTNSLLEAEELEDLRYELFGEALACEEDYGKRYDATGKLVGLWASEGISTVILKGSAFAQYYPEPQHRYSCDLDLFIGEDWKKGCSILESKGFDICYEVYKDAQFHIDGVYVECHRYLMPIRGNRMLQKFEGYLRSLLKDKVRAGEEGLFTPSLMFNALFCIEHARGHLLHEKLTLRQVCDWMMIRRQPVDWDEFWKMCDEFGFTRFAHLMDALSDMIEGKVRYEELSAVDRRVVDEMLYSESEAGGAKPSSFLKRRVRLFFDIIGNGWKYREFNDVPMPVALVRQVWTHFFDKEVRF